MSAVVAGKSCKQCKKPYYVSFGHPKWFDDVVKRGMPKSELYKQFEELRHSGMCPQCYANGGQDE